MPENELAGSCVLSDAQLLPFGAGNSGSEPGGRDGLAAEHHSGELHRASAEAKAERIIAEELERHGWQESDLAARRKSDAVKLGMAALRRETTLSTKAIALRLHLGSSKTANRSLHRYMRGGGAASAGQEQLGL